MLRISTIVLSCAFAGLLPAPETAAAGPGPARGVLPAAGAAMAVRARPEAVRRPDGMRGQRHGLGERQSRFAGRHARFAWPVGGLDRPVVAAAPAWPSNPLPLIEPEPDGDWRSFAAMPVRVGIPRPPTPEPTLYRIEGRRDRPVTRAIRIAEAEPAGSRRSRFVHAETGALLLTVPRR